MQAVLYQPHTRSITDPSPARKFRLFPKVQRKAQGSGLDTQQADDFPVCPLGYKYKMSPCMLSRLLRHSSFLICTSPPLNSTWSNTTLLMYHNIHAGVPLGCLVHLQSVSPVVQSKEKHGSVPVCAAWHSVTFIGTWKDHWGTNPHTSPTSQCSLFNDSHTCQQLSSRDWYLHFEGFYCSSASSKTSSGVIIA